MAIMVEQPVAKVYKQPPLTFYVLPNKVLVQTHHQLFYLEPSTHRWKRRITLIQNMLELGEIRNLQELADFCANGCIYWTTTNPSYYRGVIESNEKGKHDNSIAR